MRNFCILYLKYEKLLKGKIKMKNQFHAIYEQDGDWFIAFCPEIPGANGMGKTKAECRENLLEAIDLILKDSYWK